MAMGQWKKRVLVKGQRSSQTRSTKARLYLAIPPVEGWKGGHPSENGYRRSGK